MRFLRSNGSPPVTASDRVPNSGAKWLVQDSKQAEDNRLAPFRGITEAGKVEENLCSIRSTGVSTAPVREAAQRYRDSLDASQKTKNQFDIGSDRWRMWSNTHRFPRAGVSFGQLNDNQRKLAFDALKASLSARGLKQSEAI